MKSQSLLLHKGMEDNYIQISSELYYNRLHLPPLRFTREGDFNYSLLVFVLTI